jgi:hypothetical protein
MKYVGEMVKKLIPFDPEIEKNLIAESEARYDAFKRGEFEAEDWDEIKIRYEC